MSASDPSNRQNAEAEAREALRNKYVAILQRVWTEPEVCPICGSSNWNIADLVDIPVRRITPTNTADPLRLADDISWRNVYVYVPVGCTTCGYTIFFHSGILDSAAERLDPS